MEEKEHVKEENAVDLVEENDVKESKYTERNESDIKESTSSEEKTPAKISIFSFFRKM